MSETLQLPSTPGFNKIKVKEPGTSCISYVAKPVVVDVYHIGESTKISGLCKYSFLSVAGIVRGVLIFSPKSHTILTPTSVRIGPCSGPFAVNQNLQQLGMLIYESPDSSVMLIPVDVASPLLVEVDT